MRSVPGGPWSVSWGSNEPATDKEVAFFLLPPATSPALLLAFFDDDDDDGDEVGTEDEAEAGPKVPDFLSHVLLANDDSGDDVEDDGTACWCDCAATAGAADDAMGAGEAARVGLILSSKGPNLSDMWGEGWRLLLLIPAK